MRSELTYLLVRSSLLASCVVAMSERYQSVQTSFERAL